jgi:hypothetical protein
MIMPILSSTVSIVHATKQGTESALDAHGRVEYLSF